MRPNMAPSTSTRDHLVSALKADLVGPFAAGKPDEDTAQEVLKLPPSRWYLTGFLAPEEGRSQEDPDARHDPEAEDSLGAGNDEDEEETQGSEPESKRKNYLPASMGMSVFLPADCKQITVTVRFAEYLKEKAEDDQSDNQRPSWRRIPRAPIVVTLPLGSAADAKALQRDGIALPGTVGLRLVGQIKTVHGVGVGLPSGARALSLFLVNRRQPEAAGLADQQYIFQVELQLQCSEGFVARPNLSNENSHERDERIADLQFRNRCEYAVGHGVSVEAIRVKQGDQALPVNTVRTTWLPSHEVLRVKPREVKGVIVAMEELAQLTAERVKESLGQLPVAYAQWLVEQEKIPLDKESRKQTREDLLSRARLACKRIEQGIQILTTDSAALDAFCNANAAMAMAARQRSPSRYGEGKAPKWHLFQLAFVLMNVQSMADETHAERELVELIFFPTGGGKTEAYLGVIAFTLLLRRLKGRHRPDKGLGVAVLLRYTLRLLTLDQLGRAATLICALESLRRKAPSVYGDGRFAVGLWVGRSATDNTMEQASKSVTNYKNGSGPNPCPLAKCPWCNTDLGPGSLELLPDRKDSKEVRLGCLNDKCEFCRANNQEGLPVMFVDEQVYRELPCFLIATVDKFAMLPWRGETAMLFGQVHARGSEPTNNRFFFGALDPNPEKVKRLPEGLLPPELIVQDELHLISGPLGTMVGLYETAIEALCTRIIAREDKQLQVRPKIIAATATVRRAENQIQALYARRADQVSIFPPPSVDEAETYFSEVDYESPGRLYIGVAGQGRSMKAILLRTYATLLASAMRAYNNLDTAEQNADGYMTVAGYFNSLRELGGLRRLIEDEVRIRTEKSEERRPLFQKGPHPWFKKRTIALEPVELTSRESTSSIGKTKSRLNVSYQNKEERVDVLLASNMISVGVDIDRLGLMVVAGQPKTTAEYIQASSRVGRDTKWPGLVVTCLNVHKPRDRSHYEHFAAYHQSFYRFVEATSVTPFSAPAMDRGLAGTLVAMCRLAAPNLTPPKGAMSLSKNVAAGETALAHLIRRAGMQPELSQEGNQRLQDEVSKRARNLMDAWKRLTDTAGSEPAKRSYSRLDTDKTAGKAILRMALDDDCEQGSDDAKFTAPTSMRDVEATTHLWVAGRRLGGRKKEA
jgi:hypothetical protein